MIDIGKRMNLTPSEELSNAVHRLKEFEELNGVYPEHYEWIRRKEAVREWTNAVRIANLEAEVERLRAALEEIECGIGCSDGYGGCDKACKDIARKALEEQAK